MPFLTLPYAYPLRGSCRKSQSMRREDKATISAQKLHILCGDLRTGNVENLFMFSMCAVRKQAPSTSV